MSLVNHPEHDCDNCGVTHMSYTGVMQFTKEFEQKQKEILENDSYNRKCPKCGVHFDSILTQLQHYELALIGDHRSTVDDTVTGMSTESTN